MTSMFNISKALSDTNRLHILDYLSRGDKNVSEVAEELNVEENLASHHLRVLAKIGFLKNDKKGRQVFYRINKDKMVELLRELSKNPTFKEIFEEVASK